MNTIKLVLKASSAKPSPLIISALSKYNINVVVFCSQYNEMTRMFSNIEIPAIITILSVSKFRITLTSPSLFFLFNVFSNNRSLEFIFLKKIITLKIKDKYPISKINYLKLIKGTLKSMKIRIVL